MTNEIKQRLYLEWINKFDSVEAIAKHYQVSSLYMLDLIGQGMTINKTEGLVSDHIQSLPYKDIKKAMLLDQAEMLQKSSEVPNA